MEEIVITYEVNGIIKKQNYKLSQYISLRIAAKLLAEKYKTHITILDFRVTSNKTNETNVYTLLTPVTYGDNYNYYHINPPAMFNELVDKYIKLQPNH